MAQQKVLIYEAMHNLNQGFERVTEWLFQLQKLGMLTEEFVGYNVAVVEHQRAGINHMALEDLAELELTEWKQYQDQQLEYERKQAEANAAKEQEEQKE
jgi:hypothetical protein